MSDLEAKLSDLKDYLEAAAFLVSKGGKEKEAHAEIVKGLVVLSDLEETMFFPKKEADSMMKDSEEATKVCRRLKLWAKRQSQINSRILNAYLTLERSGTNVITENDLKNVLSENASFDSNFAQMKIIAEKNHGKIFELYGEKVTLWSPVVSYIREYENIVFNN